MTVTLTMLEAVTKVIIKAQQIHDGIPELTVVLGASGYTKKSQVHGHYAARAWKEREGSEQYGELMLSGESLKRGGRDTVGTILHELAHAYCNAHEIKDTSNSGRYHNSKFKEVAESFGLVIEKANTIGWSVTTVPDPTAEVYAQEIKDLDKALSQYRVPQFDLSEAKKQIKREMFCPKCQDRIQVTKGWWERNESNLTCDIHRVFFMMEEVEPV